MSKIAFYILQKLTNKMALDPEKLHVMRVGISTAFKGSYLLIVIIIKRENFSKKFLISY
jgi:hypothetical protein